MCRFRKCTTAAAGALVAGLPSVAVLGLIMGLGMIVIVAGPAAAEDGLSVRGAVSSAFVYNLNKPPSEMNDLRIFDFDHNTFKVDVAQIAVERTASEPGEAGLRFDGIAGSSIPRVAASSGLFRDASGEAQDVDLLQAYARWIAPLGGGLTVDLGKFATHIGYEVIEGVDGINENYSRSLLFGYAIPFTHTGARAAYAFSEQVSGTFLLVNGWDNARDNNSSKSVGAQLAVRPNGRLGVVGNVIVGPERDDNNSDQRMVFDAILTAQLHERVAAAVNFDYGIEQGVLPGENGDEPEDAAWMGLAGYVRVQVSERVFLNLRGELFDDPDGFRFGTTDAQGDPTALQVTEFTITPEVRLSPSAVLRAELRIDSADEDIFLKTSDEEIEAVATQPTVAVNAVITF